MTDTPPQRGWLAKAVRVIRLVRLRPFETDTERGRSNERYRRAALAALANLAGRVIRIATALITVPLTVHYLGPERYGLWLTISSVITFFSVFNFGIGDGMVNELSDAFGRDDRAKSRAVVASAFAVMVTSILSIAVLFAIAYPWVPWDRLFNLDDPLAIAEAGRSTAIVFGCWAATMCLGLVVRINRSFQNAHLNYVFEIAGSLLGLAGIIVGIELEAGLPWLALAMAGSIPLANLVMGFVLFAGRYRWLRPTIGDASRRMAGVVFRTGAWFLSVQVAVIVIMNATNIIVAQMQGPEQVQEIAIPARLFALLNMLVNLFVTPLWPAYIESLAKGDIGWIKRTLRRSIQVTLVVVLPPTIILVAFGDRVLHLWVGDAVSPTLGLLLGLGVWYLAFGVNNALQMFLNGVHAVRANALIRSAQAVAAVVFQIAFIGPFGLEGVVWGLALAEVLFRTFPSVIVVSGIVRRLDTSHRQSAPRGEPS